MVGVGVVRGGQHAVLSRGAAPSDELIGGADRILPQTQEQA